MKTRQGIAIFSAIFTWYISKGILIFFFELISALMVPAVTESESPHLIVNFLIYVFSALISVWPAVRIYNSVNKSTG